MYTRNSLFGHFVHFEEPIFEKYPVKQCKHPFWSSFILNLAEHFYKEEEPIVEYLLSEYFDKPDFE